MFTIGKSDVILMTFLSSSVVVVVMFLLPMRKTYIPSFERDIYIYIKRYNLLEYKQI